MTIDHERLTALFTEAIELDADGRAALIARVRADDDALAAELVALLQADAEAASVLRTAGLRPSSSQLATANETPRGVAPDRLSIPGYRVLGPIGEGAMGAVYAGEQQSPRRPVAIKVLHVSSGAALARFWTEAAIMARLDHPGIARVLESGESDGHPYIVMERVAGKTLDAYVRDAKPSLRVRLQLFAAICDAVHHAHLNGVIHRDLKPSNVMVRDDGRIAVLDFGIARATHGDASSGATRAGELIGTPLYMSPEQARLRPDEVDARSDVYSLGVTLYELIAGELPYPIRDLPLTAVVAIIAEDPPRSLRALGHDRDLDAITAKALAKEPGDRYQSAAALAEDVRRFLDGRAVSARTPGLLEQLRRFARRRPAAAAAIGGAIALTIAFAGVVTTLWLDARRARTTADEARARSEMARDALAQRTAALTLEQARSVVARDPTQALAYLEELRDTAIDRWAIGLVAGEARGRGVSSHVLARHRDEVHWIEEVADGSVVTASYDGTVRRWRAPGFADGDVLFQLSTGRVHVVRPAPDGVQFAIGGDGGVLYVVGRGGEARALAGHEGDVERVEWSADGAWLVSGDDRGGVLVWPRGEGPARRLDGPRDKIEALGFSSDGDAVIAGDDGGTAWVWQLASGHRRELPTGDRGGVRAVWADRDHVAAVTADGSVRRWRGAAEQPAVATGVPSKRAAFTPDGAGVVLAGIEGSIVRVDGTAVETIGTHATKIRGLAIGRTGNRIATGSEDGVVQVWDRATGRRLTLRGHRQRIRHLVFASRDSLLYSADGEGIVRRWELDRIEATFFHEHAAGIEHIAVAADAKTVVTSDRIGVIVAIDLSTGSARRVGRNPAHITALATAGGEIVTGDVEARVTWWRGERSLHERVAGAVRAIAASADGKRIAVATAAGPIAVFGADGTELALFDGHAGGTEAVAFDPSGTLLASGGQDREIRVWRVGEQLAPVASLAGPTGDVHFVRFSPTGDYLIAAGDDGTVRGWRVRAGALDVGSVRMLGEHVGAVTAIAFDRHGRYVASAGRDADIVRAELASGVVEKVAASQRGAIALAIDDRGAVLIAAEVGVVERWLGTAAPPTVVPINAGTGAGAGLPGGNLVLGGVDGAVRVISPH